MADDRSKWPIINLEIEDEVVFSPRDYFDYKKNVEGCHIPQVPINCIICFETSFINYAEQNLKIEKIDWFRKEFNLYKLVGKDIILILVNYGAALSTIALEEAIALGARRFVVLGSAGTLQKNIPVGSFVVADSAIREEGVSYHYIKPSKSISCSRKLLAKAKEVVGKETPDVNIFFGATWTTDSFYREVISKAKKYQSENVLSVDMETSALYAVAKYRSVDVLSIFYISDSIANFRWNPEFHKTNSEKTQSTLFDLAIKILS